MSLVRVGHACCDGCCMVVEDPSLRPGRHTTAILRPMYQVLPLDAPGGNATATTPADHLDDPMVWTRL